MNAKQQEELLGLADEIEKDPDHWQFRHFRSQCGTLMCALGRMPDRNPEEWEWETDGTAEWPRLRTMQLGIPQWRQSNESACVYFGITSDEADILFVPNSYSFDKDHPSGIRYKPASSTAAMVASDIRKLVAYYRSTNEPQVTQ